MAQGVDVSFVSAADLGRSEEISAHYGATPGFELQKVLRTLKIPSDSSIIDMGCGKGLSFLTFVKFPEFSRIAGCEISAELVNIAEQNLRCLGIEGVTVYCCDAATFREFDAFDYVYMFNPFFGETFDRMMENLSRSLLRAPRPVTIIYRRPSCHDKVVAGGDFVKEREIGGVEQPYFIYRHEPTAEIRR